MAMPEYKLSAVLCGHSMDVRCVATTKESCILSASRDRTAKLWHPEGVKDFANVVTYKGHNNFVSCVCWLPLCESFPEGLVITGSNDNTILGYNLQDGAVQIHLKGHDNAVCSVAPANETGILLSASWDNTARAWNVNAPQMAPVILKGHQAAVWSVIELSNGVYATASADKTIKLWRKDGALINTLTGHTDCVRGLTVASTESFLSCSNDASIRLWSNKGDCINTYYGHANYIYSISSHPGSGVFVSCGEEGAVRVWWGADSVALRLPAHSVWSLACLNNGDIVTGSSDGIVRVFTKDPTRVADEMTLKNFEEECEKMIAASQQEIGGFKLSELPGPEALLEPGKEGQTKLVRRGDTVKCYSWSARGAWDEVGDVMGATPPAPGKTRHQGQEYDFVFSVDIKDGEPALKLPFNKTEDPWVAAQAFIHRHDLPQVYLEQVANFIITNAKLDSIPVSSNGFADPFTGGSRYVPGAGPPAAPGPPAGGGLGPRGGHASPAVDPFTGEGAYTTTTNAGEKPLVPHDAYIRFDAANLKAIQDKLKEFNSKVGDGLNAFTDEQIENIVKLGEINCTFHSETVTLLKKMLEWPKEILFPVLDITRLAIRNKDINSQVFDASYGPNFVEYLLTLLTPEGLSSNRLLSLRVLVNAFSALSGEMLVLSVRELVLSVVGRLPPLADNAQIAATSLLLNLSVALCQQSDNIELADCIVNLLNKISDNEAYFRGLVALGTLLAETPNKLVIQTKIVTSTNLHNRLKRDSSANIPNFKKISIAATSLLLNLSVALCQQSDNIELADCIVNLLNKISDNEAYFRGLVALGTLLAETPNKLVIQTKIVTSTNLHNRLKRDSSANIPNFKKISIAATSLLLNLSVALCQQSDNIELADCIVNLLNKISDNEAYFRGLVALGTLLAETPNKLVIQTKIVTSTNLHNRLKRDSSANIPNFKKISIAATSLLLNLSVALCQQSDNIELADCIVNLLNKISDNEAYFRGLVALGTLLAETPNKLVIQTKIVTSTNLHNRLKRDSSANIPNFKKISVCSQQILRML